MVVAAIPVDEESRLKDLFSYDLMDTPAESDFNELVELASQICNCPISLISLLDKERQWFKAKKGIDASYTPRDVAFCSHAILDDKVMKVEDATKDPRFHDNPVVTGDLHVRFYAGAPIVSPGGFKLGTICVIDHQPKILTEDEERALSLLSNQVTRLIELRMKNMMIRERAEEIISVKSGAISKALQNNQEEKKAIASHLHELLAQDITSCMLYLNEAETNETERLLLIQKTRNQMHKSLEKLRTLTYSITPLTSSWLSIEDLVGEYIENVAATFPFEIRFKSTGKKNTSVSDKTPVTIQLVEKWLKKLDENKETSFVSITLSSDKEFKLLMEDNTPLIQQRELGDMVSACLLREIAASLGGRVDFLILEKGKNQVIVSLPF